MRSRRPAVAAALILVAFAVVACSKTAEPPAGAAPSKATTPVAPKAAPAAKAPAAPAAEPAAVAQAVKLPPAWPKDFPLPAKGTVTNTTENESRVSLDVEAPGTLPGIAEWYQATMKEKGWKLDNKDAQAEHISMNFSRKGGTASVSLNPGDPGKVALSLTWNVATEE